MSNINSHIFKPADATQYEELRIFADLVKAEIEVIESALAIAPPTTPGVAQASLAVVLDASKDITGLGDVSADTLTSLGATTTVSVVASANVGSATSSTTGLASLENLALGAATTITASGTTVADAFQLLKSVNNVTVAAAGTGVIAPSAATHGVVVITNNGANAIQVYGNGADTIDGFAAATGVTLTNAKRLLLVRVAAATYISLMGVASA